MHTTKSKYHLVKANKACVLGMMSCLLLLNACSSKLTSEEMSNCLMDKDHGLRAEEKVKGIEYSLTYRPTDLMVQQELKNSKVINDSILNKIRSEYDSYRYFVLEISAEGKDALQATSTDFGTFSQRFQALSFRLPDYAFAIADQKDTISLADFHVPRLYGMGGGLKMLLAFEKEKTKVEDFTVVLEDIGFGTGTQRFRFNTEDLNKAPRLDFTTYLQVPNHLAQAE